MDSYTQFELEYITHIIDTAFENEEAVIWHDVPDTVIDISCEVEEDTYHLETLMVLFDLQITYVEPVADNRLKVVLSKQKDWNPITLDSLQEEHSIQAFSEKLAETFGGEPVDYRKTESFWRDELSDVQESIYELYEDGELSEEQLYNITGKGALYFDMKFDEENDWTPLTDVSDE